MDFLKHRPWRRALVGGACVLVGQSLYLYFAQSVITGRHIALAFAFGIFGGILIVSALLDDAEHPHSR